MILVIIGSAVNKQMFNFVANSTITFVTLPLAQHFSEVRGPQTGENRSGTRKNGERLHRNDIFN